MRRITWPPPREKDLWRFRVLGAIIPDLDYAVAEQRENLPTPAKPILQLHMRPALLAGIAIIGRAGPEMLRMLRGHMMGGVVERLQFRREAHLLQNDRFDGMWGDEFIYALLKEEWETRSHWPSAS